MMRIFEKAGSETVTVNTGFNWWAFFFPGLWALFNGLVFAGLLGLAIPMSVLFLDADGAIFVALVTTVMMFVYGFKGNDWVCSKLEQDGYTLPSMAQPSEVTDHKPDDTIQNFERLTVSTKKCKFCAELIKREAIKCRFCGEFLVEEESENSRGQGKNDENDFENRILCSDGACVGVLDEDGNCRVCGKPGKVLPSNF